MMENFENLTYLVIPSSITGSIDYSQIIENDTVKLGCSKDGLNCIVSYISGSRPSIYNSIYQEYTYSEILTFTGNGEW